MNGIAAVIVAGGAGLRAGGERPKQYQPICGKSMIWWTLKAFAEHPAISWVQPVIGEGQQAMFAEAVGTDLRIENAVVGGETRQDSCRIGLEALARHKPQKVLIHDAARPFVSRDLISHVIAWLDRYGQAIVPGLPVADTLKLAPGGIVTKTVDRAGLWLAQTPQAFAFASILEAHRAALAQGARDLTDDSAVAEYAGIPVTMIMGRIENRKITTAEDMVIANQTIAARHATGLPDIRVGQGFDVHPFEPGDAVTLCGVRIPHERRLKGHSDADVAMHALTDAILGAIGEGDIGSHFPPSDQQWRNAASAIFLAKAMSLLQARGGVVAHADITILAETPRISTHVAAMKDVLAPLLRISPDRIGIKATTTEKLGAVGRGEGIASFATATVRLP